MIQNKLERDLHFGPSDSRVVSNLLKRLLDLTLSSILLVILSPALGLIALAVLVTSGRPVFFRQARSGLNGKSFLLVKFRTMDERRDGAGRLLPDGDRITALGKFLRRFSLDELPELSNVMKGEMSLVGPRPLLMQYLDRYSAEQARRHEVKPGITGWAQVNGRNSLSWEHKFALDVWYVRHGSLPLDFRILCLTAWQVFFSVGVHPENRATMDEFKGTSTSM